MKLWTLFTKTVIRLVQSSSDIFTLMCFLLTHRFMITLQENPKFANLSHRRLWKESIEQKGTIRFSYF